MVGWYHRINGHESKQTLGDSEGQGSLACCSPLDHRVGHDWVTEQQWISLCFSMAQFSLTLLFFKETKWYY